MISALDRDIEGSVYDNFLQTDAALGRKLVLVLFQRGKTSRWVGMPLVSDRQ